MHAWCNLSICINIHNVPELITTKKNYNKTNESAYKINNLKLSSFFFILLIIFLYIHYV